MKRIFATVGTTSFDPFIESICSMSFLTAALQCQKTSTRRRLSDPSVSSLQSTSDQQHLWPSCEILHSSKSSPSTQSSLGFSLQPSSIDRDSEGSVEILIQYGRGTCPVHFLPLEIRRAVQGDVNDEGFVSVRFPTEHVTLHIKWYRFKPSLNVDMERADLILCHAGAGTLLEALSLPKPTNDTSTPRVINAFVNSELMDNHQSELAEELEKRSHILVVKEVEVLSTDNGAHNFWKGVNAFAPKPFGRDKVRADTKRVGVSNFQRVVDRVMGISN